ncbi:hypothetical protein [uncultured Dubosiella sp.]|uniref:hypothetical protein n=2 Tax=uncultured Dubosiella sp. TaxID=1937011 RepID=UPI0025B5A27B|nr:hypothetical protein [uncultured Dubosiella sp.]
MISTLQQLKKELRIFFPDISESCKRCEYPECKGYITLFEEEIDEFLDLDIEVVAINEEVYLINNFEEKNGELNLSEISPKCKLRCANGKCGIHNHKPYICLIYPIMIEKYQDGKHYWCFHKLCQYYIDLKKIGKYEEIIFKFKKILKEIDPELKKKIYDYYFKVCSVTVSQYTDTDIDVIKEVKECQNVNRQ